MKIGFPEKTDVFYKGQDLLYQQFNDINFYIEDEEQENFYFKVLQKLFPDIKIEKIFPLNGKTNVINEARLNINIQTNVYIVDKDFDDILNKIEYLPNLFYLKRYSIENYLIEKNAIVEFIIEEKPKKTKSEISTNFDLNSFINEALTLFKDITILFIIVQHHNLGLKNVKNSPEKFFIFNPASSIKQSTFSSYMHSVENILKQKDKRLTINGQIKKYKKKIVNIDCIPGKYVLKFLKSRISHIFSMQQSYDAFSYRLVKNCQLKSLNYLKHNIIKFIST